MVLNPIRTPLSVVALHAGKTLFGRLQNVAFTRQLAGLPQQFRKQNVTLMIVVVPVVFSLRTNRLSALHFLDDARRAYKGFCAHEQMPERSITL
jgi:hypothetical protein